MVFWKACIELLKNDLSYSIFTKSLFVFIALGGSLFYGLPTFCEYKWRIGGNFMKKYLITLLFCLLSPVVMAQAQKSPEGAKSYIISPKNGETVSSPVTIQFGLKGMGIAPAGVKYPNTGHHHLLINVDKLPFLKTALPKDERHIHFGGGQTETTLDLKPGQYTLQLLLADELHVPHEPPVVSEKITITVK